MTKIIKKVWFWPGIGYDLKECVMPEQYKGETPYCLEDYFAYAVKNNICDYMTPQEFANMVQEDGGDPQNPEEYEDRYTYFDGTDNFYNPIDPVYILTQEMKIETGEDDRVPRDEFYVKKIVKFDICKVIEAYNNMVRHAKDEIRKMSEIDDFMLNILGKDLKNITEIIDRSLFAFNDPYFLFYIDELDGLGRLVSFHQGELDWFLLTYAMVDLEDLYEALVEEENKNE